MKSFIILVTVLFLSLGSAQADILYFHPDHLGSLAVMTDSFGNVQQIEHYTPFGEIFSTLHSTLNTSHFQFTGQENDRESDLYDYGARYYDSILSQFISPDPVIENPTYTYTHNNPIRWIDPDGRQSSAPPLYNSDLEAFQSYITSNQPRSFTYHLRGSEERKERVFTFRDVVSRGPFDPSGIQYEANIVELPGEKESSFQEGYVRLFSPYYNVIKAFSPYFQQVQGFVDQHKEPIEGTPLFFLSDRFKGFLVTSSGTKFPITLSTSLQQMGRLEGYPLDSPFAEENIIEVAFYEDDKKIDSLDMRNHYITPGEFHRFLVGNYTDFVNSYMRQRPLREIPAHK
ncbi:MAG: RHS repeat-associated core domain-containing protein [Deltaproteobacteria bacterium]|nr:RHS repeat-associated core domain-containing protein [Deltaproteobacteria bacterium]